MEENNSKIPATLIVGDCTVSTENKYTEQDINRSNVAGFACGTIFTVMVGTALIWIQQVVKEHRLNKRRAELLEKMNNLADKADDLAEKIKEDSREVES